MKPIKKFSAILESDQSVLESLTKTHGAGLLDLVKKLGYNSIEEIAKEKKLLTKLESLLKDIPKKADISEDEAEEIEDKEKEMGEPKSVESEGKELEETEKAASGTAVPKEEGDGEETADEIEDDELEVGEPEELPGEEGTEKVSDEQEVTKEVPDEADEVEDEDGIPKAEEDVETPKATRRIKTFEDFVEEGEETINKNVNYHDDNEEDEDYAAPVADSANPISEDDEEEGIEDEKKGDELEDEGDKKVDHEDDHEKADHYKGAVKTDDAEIDALKKDVDYDEEEEAKDESAILSFNNFISEKYDRVVLGGNKGDKSKTHDGEDYEEEDKDEAVKETFTFADAVDTAGEDVKKNEKGIASALKALKARKADDISIMTDTTEDDGLYDAIEGMKTLPIDSSIYDSAYAGKYKGKDVVVFNDGDDLFAYVKEGVKETVNESKIKVTKEKWPYLEFKDGGKIHKVEFEYEDIIDDHGNEGQDQYWVGKDEKGQEWMIDVYADSRGEVEDIRYDTIVKESVDKVTAIPVEKGDGSESAAGIAATTMEKGKPKEEPASKGEELVTKDQEVEEEPETAPDQVGDEKVLGGKVVTSVPDTDITETLTKKQEKLPDALKKAILKKEDKTDEDVLEDDTIAEKFRKIASNKLTKVNEKEIKSAEEFKEYAMKLLKSAHGDDFDEAKADEVVKGLEDKYKDDFGAMVGALQSSMG